MPEHSEHIVSPKIYFTIFIALVIGTSLTTWAAFQNFGPFNIVIALGIATAKATLVVLFFMHARYSVGRTRLVIVCAIFWLAIMLALTLADYQTRQPRMSRLVPPAVFYRV
ncbi:MAG: oxidase [Acidobacteria bacterium]|nr:MAG: oxidase [Acidobacteriota bacterium]